MYISIKELSGRNGFIVEWRIHCPNDPWGWRSERQKFFPTHEAIVQGLPTILSEAV